MFCLVALIVFPFVFVIVSCHCLVIVIVSYISLLSKLAHKPTKQLCIARTARTDLAMQKLDRNKVAMYCVRAFKINIKMNNVLHTEKITSQAQPILLSVITELGLLSEFRGGWTKRGRVAEKCSKKVGRFPHLNLRRLVSEASGTYPSLVVTLNKNGCTREEIFFLCICTTWSF